MTTTIVYDTAKDPYGGTPESIIDTCEGNAIEERDELLRGAESYNAVIDYMLGKGYMQEPMEFLRCWNEGDFDSLRKEWPDAPEEIYYADPLSKQ